MARSVFVEFRFRKAFKAAKEGDDSIWELLRDRFEGTGFRLDEKCPAIPMDLGNAPDEGPPPKPRPTVLVRAVLEDDDEDEASPWGGSRTSRAARKLIKKKNVVGVYTDPAIVPHGVCTRANSRNPVRHRGTYRNVQQLLHKDLLQQHGMTGNGVWLAILDSGVNTDFLTQRTGPGFEQGIELDFDADKSHSLVKGVKPGEACKEHGTVMAFDAWITAPEYTLLDFPILKLCQSDEDEQGDFTSQFAAGFLFDACAIYCKLIDLLKEYKEDKPRLVVNNSWGVKHLRGQDARRGHPMNYSYNFAHPFNRIVRHLAAAGADILFSAGNCGETRPNGVEDPCSRRGPHTIYGANSHPDVLSIGAVTVNQHRIGYSSRGYGALSCSKPDVCCYAHFRGAEVPGTYANGRIDVGTSTASAVASGVVTAIRSQYPPDKLPPRELRKLIRKTANKLDMPGYEQNYGYGILDVQKLIKSILRRYP